MVIGDKCAYWPNCTRDAPQIALRKSLYILLGGLWVVRHQHTRHVDHSNGIASVCWVAHDVAHKIGNYNQAPRIIPYADLAVGHSVLASGTKAKRGWNIDKIDSRNAFELIELTPWRYACMCLTHTHSAKHPGARVHNLVSNRPMVAAAAAVRKRAREKAIRAAPQRFFTSQYAYIYRKARKRLSGLIMRATRWRIVELHAMRRDLIVP